MGLRDFSCRHRVSHDLFDRAATITFEEDVPQVNVARIRFSRTKPHQLSAAGTRRCFHKLLFERNVG
jgi:hypothetical protein